MSDDDDLCHACGAPYAKGKDCEECQAVRRKDMVVRLVMVAMFVLPMLTLIGSLLYGMLGGTPGVAVPD
ncbi:hypothetical protein [Azospirillum sp. sgz301742]